MRDPDRGHDLPPRGASPRPSRVFISWSRDADDAEHADRVLELANHLRREGVDARLDRYEVSPAEGWAQWARREFEAAEYILVVCTAAYRQRFDGDEPAASGRAVRWEGQLLRQRLFEDPNFGARVVPVLLVGATPEHIPGELRGQTAYQLPADHDDLYRRLTGQPGVLMPPLGELRRSPSNLPAPPPNFVGRDRELADIAAALARENSAALVQAITGLGGVGKTRLALEYAHCHARDYDVRWWVRAATLEQDLVDLGRVLGVLSQPDDVDRSFPEILAWLRNHRRWLLVVDNADDPSGLRERLPLSAAGHILITSRARSWRGVAAPLEIPILPRPAAIELLVDRSGRADDGHADAVARALGDLPLALVQAGACVEQTGCTFAEYLERLCDEGIELLRDRLGETGDYYQETVATTWRLNLAAVRHELPAAADLLDVLAFLDPDGVPLALLRSQPGDLPSPVAALITAPRELDKALALLRRFSLVDREDGVLRVHRLVQAVTRDALAPATRRHIATMLVAWARALFRYDPEDPQVGCVPAGLAAQIIALGALKECREASGSALVRELGDLSHYFLVAGSLASARDAATRALETAEILAHAEPGNSRSRRDLSASLDMLGKVELHAGDFISAYGHFARAVTVDVASLTANEHSVFALRNLLVSLTQLGQMNGQAGDLAVARELLVHALKVSEVLAAADPTNLRSQRDLSVTLNNLGDVEFQAGNLATARGYYDRVLAVSEALAAANPQSPGMQRKLALALARLGNVEAKVGNLVAARGFLCRDLAICERLAREDPNNAQRSLDLICSHITLSILATMEEDAAAQAHHLASAMIRMNRMLEADQVRGYSLREAVLAMLIQASSATREIWKYTQP